MFRMVYFLLSSRLEMKVTKSSGGVPRLSYTGRDDRHFLPTGLYVIKTVNGADLFWAKMCLATSTCFNNVKGCVGQNSGDFRLIKKCARCLSLLSLCPLEPWTMAYSKNSKMKFFYNKTTKTSTYEMPPNSAAPFKYVQSSQHIFHLLIQYYSDNINRKLTVF